jgi:hypothetical protein
MVEFGGQEEEKDEEEEAEEEEAIDGDAQGEMKAAMVEDPKKPEMRKRMSSVRKEVKENLAQGTGKKEVSQFLLAPATSGRSRPFPAFTGPSNRQRIEGDWIDQGRQSVQPRFSILPLFFIVLITLSAFYLTSS